MSNFKPSFKREGTYTPDMLVAGDHPVRTLGVVLAPGQNLRRGALLGRITASGLYQLSVAAASDGSEIPVAILGEDVDSSGGPTQAFVYVAGDFNTVPMTFGAGHSAGSVRESLYARSIYLHSALNA